MWDHESLALHYWYADRSTYDQPLTWLVACLIGTLGNADLVATFILHKHTRSPYLVNLTAGNILAMFCLPLNYLHHFNQGWSLGRPVCKLLWLSRDLATGVQVFSLVLGCVLRFCKPRTGYEVLPHKDVFTITSDTKVRADVLSGTAQTLVIWALAVFYALPKPVLLESTCSIRDGDVFEDNATKSAVIFHSLAFCFVPLAIILLLTCCRKTGVRDGRTVVLWLTIVLIVNYVPLYTWMLSTWASHKYVTMIFVDFATYFPLYSTAGWVPVVIYITRVTTSEEPPACRLTQI